MDNQIDVETLRERLKSMARKDVLKLAAAAKVSASTVQKFRARLIKEPGAFKVEALIAALEAQQSVTQPRRKKAAA